MAAHQFLKPVDFPSLHPLNQIRVRIKPNYSIWSRTGQLCWRIQIFFAEDFSGWKVGRSAQAELKRIEERAEAGGHHRFNNLRRSESVAPQNRYVEVGS